jgi:hypothetical protein
MSFSSRAAQMASNAIVGSPSTTPKVYDYKSQPKSAGPNWRKSFNPAMWAGLKSNPFNPMLGLTMGLIGWIWGNMETGSKQGVDGLMKGNRTPSQYIIDVDVTTIWDDKDEED